MRKDNEEMNKNRIEAEQKPRVAESCRRKRILMRVRKCQMGNGNRKREKIKED
jgi:hypothetical protein